MNKTIINKIKPFYRSCFDKGYLVCNKKSMCTQKNAIDKSFKEKINNGPNLLHFLKNNQQKEVTCQQYDYEDVPYVVNLSNKPRKVYFDVYGCQMNVNDTEIVYSILKDNNFERTLDIVEADVVLIMTCAIRDSAEEKIWGRLRFMKGIKQSRKKDRPKLKIGILGCMAERLKEKVLEKNSLVDVVAGPDSYRHLPRLLSLTENDQKSINVVLSFEETYADIAPVRLNENSISAFVSIMRGCDNMCTYCIVPFTRGRERSRPITSILREVEYLSKQGVKEVTLLGQNVNSYRDTSVDNKLDNITSLANGFKTVYKPKKGGLRFADLLEEVAKVDPEMRIRFTSPHPKDFPDEVLEAIHSHRNICKYLHMPAQSGSTAVLDRMRRGYTREAYIELIKHIRNMIPDVALSSDFICGFCGETDEEFEETLSLIDEIKYNTAFLFAYSMREKTTAHRRYKDDVPAEIKQYRLKKMIETFRRNAEKINQSQIGKNQIVLIEGISKRSTKFLQGRNDQNIRVIIPPMKVPYQNGDSLKNINRGDYVVVRVNEANSQTLRAVPLYLTNLRNS
ncbi:CDK5RAP1-like protein [Diorhabda carinulata]|uniref:CDK5RAP1-like protein n=1 Tax=Diorhabda carinulata TaxID=1163345 RepID=UPI0025A2E660|nr:CDK5RAP1-like protein [Diorhabda carinulata]